MNHHHKKPPLVQILAGRLLFASIFVISAIALVLFAFGYKVDFSRRNIQPTGVITIEGDVSDVQIYANGHLYGKKLPISIIDLKPNNAYHLLITKPGYVNWSKDVYVSSGLISAVQFVRLLPTQSIPGPSATIDKFSLCNRNTPSRAEGLLIDGGQLFTQMRLITRVSTVINDACWLGDANHVVYLAGRDIHIIEADGANDTLLYAVDEDIAEVAAASNGKSVYYHTLSDKWFEIKLQ